MFKIFFISSSIAFGMTLGTAQEEPFPDLDPHMGWQKVVAYSPALAAAESAIEMCEANQWQARLRPNPILSIEGDNLGVSERDHGAEPPQTTYALSQLIELGGKRFARFALAAGEKEAAYWDAHVCLLNLNLAFWQAFIKTAYMQERVQLAQKREEVALSLVDATECQLNNGSISPLVLKKNQVHLKAIQLQTKEAATALILARNELASLWGSCPDFATILYNFFSYSLPPCLEEAQGQIEETADFAGVFHRINLARRELELQKTFRIPDVNVTVGLRTFKDSDTHGWVIGAELPIPILNTNQGNIKRACIGVTQAEYQLQEWIRGWNEKVIQAHQKWDGAVNTCLLMEEGLLCEARAVHELTAQSYQMGKVDYFELLQAEENLYAVEEQYLAVLYEYHLNHAEWVRLMGLLGN